MVTRSIFLMRSKLYTSRVVCGIRTNLSGGVYNFFNSVDHGVLGLLRKVANFVANLKENNVKREGSHELVCVCVCVCVWETAQ